MKTATITETKNHLSALLHEVQRGETVVVLDRKRPVARIESVISIADYRTRERVERLQNSGVLLTSRGGCATDVLSKRPPKPTGATSAVHALCEERETGR